MQVISPPPALRQVKFSAIWKRFCSLLNYFKDIGLTIFTCMQYKYFSPVLVNRFFYISHQNLFYDFFFPWHPENKNEQSKIIIWFKSSFRALYFRWNISLFLIFMGVKIIFLVFTNMSYWFYERLTWRCQQKISFTVGFVSFYKPYNYFYKQK